MTNICGELVAGQQCQLQSEHIVPCSPDPDGGWIPVPNTPYNEIVPRLYQGGTINGGVVFRPSEHDFDSVLTLYRSAPWCDAPINERRFVFNDGLAIPDGLDDAVGWVYGQWAIQKKHVLVRCQAGLNRSGLIVALTLIKDGHDPDDAIRVIREKRSAYALCNKAFVAHLQGAA